MLFAHNLAWGTARIGRENMKPKKLPQIPKSTDKGVLRLVYGVPKGETFLLREKKEEELRLMRRDRGRETTVGYLAYTPGKEGIKIRRINTEPGYRRRDVAASLIAYLKARDKDLHLKANPQSYPFYKKIGFEEKETLQMVLPREKPLLAETGKRRFYIRKGRGRG